MTLFPFRLCWYFSIKCHVWLLGFCFLFFFLKNDPLISFISRFYCQFWCLASPHLSFKFSWNPSRIATNWQIKPSAHVPEIMKTGRNGDWDGQSLPDCCRILIVTLHRGLKKMKKILNIKGKLISAIRR